MKKRGFTLIELLAVIVVLSIIALIVIPIVTKTIKNAEKGSAEIATQNYIRAVELAISNSDLNRKSIPDGSYTIDSDGNLTGTGLPDGKLEIDANGDRPIGGTIVIKDGMVTTDSTITVGDYEVAYNPTTKKYEAAENSSTSTTTVYGWVHGTINVGTIMSDSTQYTTDPTSLEKDYYLKYELDKDKKLTSIQVCGNFNGNEYCLSKGTYGYATDTANYTGNLSILKGYEAGGLSCSYGEEMSLCSNGSVDLSAFIDEHVMVRTDGGNCNVYGDSASCTSL